MSDTVITHTIDSVANYGPWWIIITLVIIAVIILLVKVAPAIKHNIEQRGELDKQSKEIEVAREKRKHDEMVARNKQDGRIAQLLQENTRVIERNSEVFKQLIESTEAQGQRDRETREALNEVKESVDDLEVTVQELRIDFAKKG